MYFFLHIPKSAGTAVKTITANHSNSINSRKILDISNLETKPLVINRTQYKVVFGHYGIKFIQQHAQKGDKRATFLRDPYQRLISLYNYWESGQAKGCSDVTDIVNGRDFESFMLSEEPVIKEQLCNIQTWMLAADYRMPERIRLKNLKPWEVLSLAKLNLQQFDFIGFQEDFSLSMLNFANQLDIPGDAIPNERVNKTVKNNEIKLTDDLIELMHPFVKLDIELYDYARMLARKKGFI